MAGLNKFQKDQVYNRLASWALWQHGGASGYASGSAMFSLAGRSDTQSGGCELWSPAIEETDRAVASLPEEEKRVIKIIFMGDDENTMEQKARKVQMSSSKFYRRRDSAYAMIYVKLFPVPLEA